MNCEINYEMNEIAHKQSIYFLKNDLNWVWNQFIFIVNFKNGDCFLSSKLELLIFHHSKLVEFIYLKYWKIEISYNNLNNEINISCFYSIWKAIWNRFQILRFTLSFPYI